MVLLSSCLLVAAAMAARQLSAKVASIVALMLSVGLTALGVWYHQLYVHAPVSAAYGFYLGLSTAGLAVVLSALASVVAWGR